MAMLKNLQDTQQSIQSKLVEIIQKITETQQVKADVDAEGDATMQEDSPLPNTQKSMGANDSKYLKGLSNNSKSIEIAELKLMYEE
jgi:hypothetical protein|tara:strand:+ start:410 stop:667 length:258 start_codon:yes stop_codon:yes gene_type:complete